jgi:hypothetical protein
MPLKPGVKKTHAWEVIYNAGVLKLEVSADFGFDSCPGLRIR